MVQHSNWREYFSQLFLTGHVVYNQAYNQIIQTKETKQTFFQYISSFQYLNSFGLHEKRKTLTSALVTKIGFVTVTNWLLFGGLYQHAMNDIRLREPKVKSCYRISITSNQADKMCFMRSKNNNKIGRIAESVKHK